MTEITEKEFESYEWLRQSSLTNMCNLELVSGFTHIDRESLLFLMQHYDEIEKKYPLVKEHVAKKREHAGL
jgi:hypothetical protein